MSPRPPSEPGRWAALSVHPSFPWPGKEECITYRNHGIWLMPAVDDLYPMVAIECGEARIASDDGYRLLRQFLSSLVWAERRSVVIASGSRGTYPFRHRMPSGVAVVKSLSPVHFDYIPEPDGARQLLSLALYREAMETTNSAYQVLGFFKILNVLYSDGNRLKRRINANLNRVRFAQSRLDELRKKRESIGDYLWKSWRCAVAHAFSAPLVDPDDPKDYKRLSQDAGLIREFAEILIEQELGINSAQAVRREHLYELAGFKDLLGADLVKVLRSGELPVDGLDIPDLPPIGIRLRDENHFEALENLSVRFIGWLHDKILVLRCSKGSDAVVAHIGLNFRGERLGIDIEHGIAVHDDGTPQSARFCSRYHAIQAKILFERCS
jgi:hypothetical protein